MGRNGQRRLRVGRLVSVRHPEGGSRMVESEGLAAQEGGWLEYGVSEGYWSVRDGDGGADKLSRDGDRVEIEDLGDLVVFRLFGQVEVGLCNEGNVIWLGREDGGDEEIKEVTGVRVVMSRDFSDQLGAVLEECDCVGVVLEMDRDRAYQMVLVDGNKPVEDFELRFE